MSLLAPLLGGRGESGSQGSHHAKLASTPWSYVALPLWFCIDSRFGSVPPDQQETLGYRLMAKVQIVLDRFGGKSETTRWQATAKVNRQLARCEYRLPDFVTQHQRAQKPNKRMCGKATLTRAMAGWPSRISKNVGQVSCGLLDEEENAGQVAKRLWSYSVFFSFPLL